MRTLRIAVVVCGVVVARTAAAQSEPKPAETPPVVQMDNAATGQPAAPPGPAAAPAGPVAGAPAEVLTAANSAASYGGAASSSDFKFDYHGYFRAPLRIGVAHNNDAPGVAAGQSTSTIHNPIVPDDQYVSWQYTSLQSKDWAELFLSYGNSLVKGTVGLQGFQFSDAAWAQATAQFGISQGWITITPKPRLPERAPRGQGGELLEQVRHGG